MPTNDRRDLLFFQAEDGIRDYKVTGVQTCALPISILFLKRALAGFDYQAVHLLCELRGEQWSNTNQEKNRGHYGSPYCKQTRVAQESVTGSSGDGPRPRPGCLPSPKSGVNSSSVTGTKHTRHRA